MQEALWRGGDGFVPGFLNTGRAELGTSRPNPFHEYTLPTRPGDSALQASLPAARTQVHATHTPDHWLKIRFGLNTCQSEHPFPQAYKTLDDGHRFAGRARSDLD